MGDVEADSDAGVANETFERMRRAAREAERGQQDRCRVPAPSPTRGQPTDLPPPAGPAARNASPNVDFDVDTDGTPLTAEELAAKRRALDALGKLTAKVRRGSAWLRPQVIHVINAAEGIVETDRRILRAAWAHALRDPETSTAVAPFLAGSTVKELFDARDMDRAAAAGTLRRLAAAGLCRQEAQVRGEGEEAETVRGIRLLCPVGHADG